MSPLLLAVALAQDVPALDMNVQYFRPSIDASDTLWVDDVQGGHDGWITPRFLLHYADSPATYRFDSSAEVPVVNGVAMGEVLVGWRSGPLRAGLDVPVVLSAEGLAKSGEFGLGDIGVDLQVGSAGEADDVRFGGAVRYAAPTATTVNPLGNPSGDVEAMGIAHVPFGDRLALVANAGVGAHPGVEVEGLADLQVRGRGALSYHLSSSSGLASEWVARLPLGAGDGSTQPTAVETMLSGWVGGGASTVRAGLGTSMAGGLGASRLRAVLGVEWGPQPPPPDTDGDGIIDADDACRLEAEDMDGVLDTDGCPDPTPRVLIGLISGGGTPLEGRLRVRQGGRDLGTRPAGQRWELEPGEYEVLVVDGPVQEAPQGLVVTPEEALQTAHIAVLRPGSVSLRAVSASGDPVEARFFVDGRNPVGEGDAWSGELAEGAHTVLVRAPGYQPKRLQLVVDADQPVSQQVTLSPARAKLDGDRIAIAEKVYFDTGSATIQARSLPLLDEVVAILQEHPEILLLRVEGHTDVTGDPAANLKLSRSRAAAVVDYLIAQGIDLERLDSVGFGSSKPLMEGESEEANAANRRVELVVAKRQ